MKATMRKAATVMLLVSTNVFAAGHLVVENAWIRNAPPGTAMMAGYGVLHNIGDAPVTVTGADSADFGSASLHKSTSSNGMEHMQPLGDITIGPGQRVTFAPGGNHIMLMQPKKELRIDESVPIHIVTKDADSTIGIFIVRDAAP